MRIISFYLPQYHPIPENDQWWGKGFTDWTNVAKSNPRFMGHHQPHLPADLGFYDLRLEETRLAQAELAKQYGIHGFCYYHYWFNGKMLLEQPFDKVLASGKPDLPFCLCWANENWTRTWDGRDREVLIAQDYDRYDPEQHILWLDRAFADQRYIRIQGKPLFLVYRPEDIPDIGKIIWIWREVAKRKGYPGIYLCCVKNFKSRLSHGEAIDIGFDAVVDFKPNLEDVSIQEVFTLPRHWFSRFVNRLISALGLEERISKRPVTSVYSYRKMVLNAMRAPRSPHKVFPCVIPGWDNTPRRRVFATVIQNDDPEIYRRWLEHSMGKVRKYEPEEQIVFVNAWNEWAEGCHLEPDLRNGRRFLEATRDVLEGFDHA